MHKIILAILFIVILPFSYSIGSEPVSVSLVADSVSFPNGLTVSNESNWFDSQLWAVIIGGCIVFLSSIGMELYKKRQFKKSIASGIVAEITEALKTLYLYLNINKELKERKEHLINLSVSNGLERLKPVKLIYMEQNIQHLGLFSFKDTALLIRYLSIYNIFFEIIQNTDRKYIELKRGTITADKFVSSNIDFETSQINLLLKLTNDICYSLGKKEIAKIGKDAIKNES